MSFSRYDEDGARTRHHTHCCILELATLCTVPRETTDASIRRFPYSLKTHFISLLFPDDNTFVISCISTTGGIWIEAQYDFFKKFKHFCGFINSFRTLGCDEGSMLTYAYPHKPPRKIEVASWNHHADCPFYWGLTSAPVIHKQREEYGLTWHRMSSLRPGTIKQHKTHSNSNWTWSQRYQGPSLPISAFPLQDISCNIYYHLRIRIRIRIYLLARRNLLWDILRLPSSRRAALGLYVILTLWRGRGANQPPYAPLHRSSPRYALRHERRLSWIS